MLSSVHEKAVSEEFEKSGLKRRLRSGDADLDLLGLFFSLDALFTLRLGLLSPLPHGGSPGRASRLHHGIYTLVDGLGRLRGRLLKHRLRALSVVGLIVEVYVVFPNLLSLPQAVRFPLPLVVPVTG